MAQQPNSVGGVLERIDHYPDHLQAIGLVVTEFSRLEGALCLLLWQLLEDPTRASAVYWTLASSKARTDVIRGAANATLIGQGWQPIKDEIIAVVTDSRAVAEKRNDIAHGQWGTPATHKANPFLSLQRPATKSPVFQRRWTVEELEKVAEDASAAHIRSDRITQVLMYAKQPETRLHINALCRQHPGLKSYFQKYLEPLQMDHLLD